MELEKIILVVIFLAGLLILQLYFSHRNRVNSDHNSSSKGLKLASSLKLANSVHAEIILTGGNAFLIVSNKNSPPSITTINYEPNSFDKVEQSI